MIARRLAFRMAGGATLNLAGAFRHHEVVGAWGDDAAALETGGISLDQPGVVVAAAVEAGSASRLVEAMHRHRHRHR
ncbi:MAG: hypothetical protein M3011_01485 [Actinomycetota bacterium]|nr:hypothetical protein [Actinomycetota bacterium]